MSEKATIGYTRKDHLIELQEKAETAMLKEFHEGTFTMEKPLIKYNLYQLNTLSAVMCFTTEEPTAVVVRVVGKTKQADLYHTFPRCTEHVLPIVGLYSDYDNTIEVYPYQKEDLKVTHHIKTPRVDTHDLVKSMDTTAAHLEDNMIFLCPATAKLAIAVDYAGDIRLDFSRPMIWDIKQLPNGHFMMSSDRLMKMPYFLSGLYEFDMVGKIYKEYRVPFGYHHDMAILPNGDILALNCDDKNGTDEDGCALIDGKTGALKRTYRFNEFLKPGCQKSGSWSDQDWFHCNSVWYDENTDSIVLSGRHVNAIVNIDFKTGKLNWILSDPEGWPEEYQKYLFKPVGDGDFEWQYEQHAAAVTPKGDITCLDNHHWGSQNPDHYLKAVDSYTRGVKWRIDTEKMEIEQVWQYGKERGTEFYSPYISNVVNYGENHYLVHSGGIAWDDDHNASEKLGSRLWAANPGKVDLESITVELSDGEKLLELKVANNYYRGEKVKLYHETGPELTLGRGQILGEVGETTQTDYDIPAEEKDELVPEWQEARLEEESDLLTFYCKFNGGELVQLLLESKDETRRYFISTSHGERGAMCSGTFLSSDKRDTRTVIAKQGLNGVYQVKLLIDDVIYQTGLTIHA